jgi:hypothetical protein
MLKLNASYSKKVPADTEYSSQSYHASVEVELPDGLTTEQLNAKIRETFALVRDSVEVELHSEPANTQNSNVSPLPIPPAQSQQNKTGYSKNGKSSDTPASPKQIKYLLDIARQIGYTVDQLKARFNVPALESLTKTQCSRAIDELNGKAA